MIGIATRKVHLIEVLIVVIAFGWGIFTWLDILSQFGRAYGLGRLGLEGAMWILAVGAMAWALMYWKALRGRALVPAILILGVFLAMPLVRSIATHRKEERFLAGSSAYLDLLEQVRQGKVRPGSLPIESLPAALRGCCFLVTLTRDSSGAVGGRFVTDMAYGPKFGGWVYTEGGPLPDDATIAGAPAHGRMVTARWYRYSE